MDQRRRPRWRLGAALVCVIVALLLMIVGSQGAAAAEPGLTTGAATSSAPVDVKVGFELLAIRKINSLAGEFEAEFNLSFRCSADCEPAGFLLENGRINGAIPTVKTARHKAFLVRAQLAFDVATRRIPFDRQVLPIQLRAEDPGLRYELDREAVATDLDLAVLDWMAGRELEIARGAPVLTDGPPVFRWTFGVPVGRPVLWSVLRFMLPALALMFSALLVLVLRQDFKAKLGMAMAALVGQVFLQLSVGGRVPMQEALTYWDAFLIISYGIVFLLVIYLLVDSHLEDQERTDARKRLLFWARAVLPSSWLVAQAIVAIAFLR